MMGIVNVSIQRAVFAVMLISALVGLGWMSIGRLGVDLFPNVEFPFVVVTTTLEGTSPETVETEITDIIEENVNTISGIESLRSVSAEGVSQVFVEFGLSEDVDVKAQDVRDKVQQALASLPQGVDPPIVGKVDPDSAPIISVMIAGDASIRDITTYADEVAKETLQRIDGVGSITLIGGRKRAIRLWLDADKLRSFAVTADDVFRAVQSEHAELPGGRLEVAGGLQEFGVKTLAEAQTPQEFARLVVANRPNGQTVLVGDVARVEDGLADERTAALLNGRRGVSLEIRKQSGRNTVEVAHQIKAEVERLRSHAPDGIEIIVTRDISRFIESSIKDVTHDLIIAVMLVVAVTLVFLLNLRATLIVAIAIPTSLIATFFAFYVFGFTINILTLLALTVAIGLLVDDAIVVVEAIARELEHGKPPMQAALDGTHKVGLAVLAGTASTLAVFVPIAFMSGIVGRFFFQYGLAIVFSVSVSLLVALTLTPMLASRLLKSAEPARWLKPIDNFWKAVDRVYASIVRWAVRFRYLVILLGIGSLFAGGYFASHVPSGFTSKADRSEFQGSVELPLGTGVAAARQTAARLDAALRNVDYIEDVFITVGAGAQGKSGKLDIYVALAPKADRPVNQFPIMDNARAVISQIVPEAVKASIVEVPWVSGSSSGAFDIDLVVRGSDLEAISAYTTKISQLMNDTGKFVDTQTSYEAGRPEVQIAIDRMRAGDQQISARTLATTARIALGGLDAATFEDGGKRYDVRIRLEENQRQTIRSLGRIQVRGNNGRLVDLASVANIEFASGPAQIDRLDRARKISVFSGPATGISLGEATDTLLQIIADNPLPDGMSYSIGGMSERMADSKSAIGLAMLLAMAALYMVLASQFNSFSQPVVIMLTAPLSFSGAFAALYFFHFEMSLFAQIGLIGMMGIVMKNGILLVDRANQLIAEGMTGREAICTACPERLRPVLMTALSAIFGMIPVALATSDGAEWRNALGALLIGGLASSTILTLIVVPAAFVIPRDVARLLRWIVAIPGRLLKEKVEATPAE